MHQGLTPAIGSDSATQPWVLDCPLKMACFCFTALDGLIESPPPVQYLSSQCTNEDSVNRESWTFTPVMKTPPPPGPATLYVCHESRTAALRHYELAFGGTNCQPDTDTEFAEAWQKAGHGQKRIWVNYEIDTIFMPLEKRMYTLYSCIPSRNALEILAAYGAEAVNKIKWLAFSENWCRAMAMEGPREWWTSYLPEGLNNFISLKGILLHHIEYYSRKPEPGFGLEDSKQLFLAALEMEKQDNPEWKIDLLKIKIQKGPAYGYNDGRGLSW